MQTPVCWEVGDCILPFPPHLITVTSKQSRRSSSRCGVTAVGSWGARTVRRPESSVGEGPREAVAPSTGVPGTPSASPRPRVQLTHLGPGCRGRFPRGSQGTFTPQPRQSQTGRGSFCDEVRGSAEHNFLTPKTCHRTFSNWGSPGCVAWQPRWGVVRRPEVPP